MDKGTFLSALREKLSALPQADTESYLEYYAEMLDERVEDGMDEQAAVQAIGTPDEVAAQILSQIPLSRLVRETIRPRRRLHAWEIVLLTLGAPLWLPLLVCVLAVLLALYIVLWACAAVLYATDLSFAAGALSGVVGCVLCLQQGHTMPAGVYIGASLVCVGAAVLLFFCSNLAVKGIIHMTHALGRRVRAYFMRKEAAK